MHCVLMDKNYSAKNFLISAPSSSLFPMDALNKSNHYYSFAIKSNLPHFAYSRQLSVMCKDPKGSNAVGTVSVKFVNIQQLFVFGLHFSIS